MTRSTRRSMAPWLFGLAVVLTLLSVVVFVGVWAYDDFASAVLATMIDLALAIVAGVASATLAARRAITHVRTAVTGHPQGRAGRIADYHAARWTVARDRFAALQREYAAYEADPRAVAARPALTDVTVPATARFVQAYADAEYLRSDTEPAGPRREEFAVSVDRAVACWQDARRVADGLATAAHRARHTHRTDQHPRTSGPARAIDPRQTHGPFSGEYAHATEAVREAAARGTRDLRARMQP